MEKCKKNISIDYEHEFTTSNLRELAVDIAQLMHGVRHHEQRSFALSKASSVGSEYPKNMVFPLNFEAMTPPARRISIINRINKCNEI